ncbi:MAG: NADH-quinone oxidoreductase subunit J [Ignavibacteria bacterium]|nr:NADH-quinone oxidoreductase subunit J [Ignavibacteria bacterium]
MNTETIIFLIAGIAAIVTAVIMITRKNPIISAIFLILNFFMVAVIYLLLKAQFIAIIQILVYMGAIMVLFLFVIMLLNVREDRNNPEEYSYKKITSSLLAILLMALLGLTVYFGFTSKVMHFGAEKIGQAEPLGRLLFTGYSFLVIAAGMMLLAAVVGAIMLAKKKFE